MYSTKLINIFKNYRSKTFLCNKIKINLQKLGNHNSFLLLLPHTYKYGVNLKKIHLIFTKTELLVKLICKKIKLHKLIITNGIIICNDEFFITRECAHTKCPKNNIKINVIAFLIK